MSLIALENYAEGKWCTASSSTETLFNAITGDPIYTAGSAGLDFDAMMKYGRKVGNKNLRKMTFQQR